LALLGLKCDCENPCEKKLARMKAEEEAQAAQKAAADGARQDGD